MSVQQSILDSETELMMDIGGYTGICLLNRENKK